MTLDTLVIGLLVLLSGAIILLAAPYLVVLLTKFTIAVVHGTYSVLADGFSRASADLGHFEVQRTISSEIKEQRGRVGFSRRGRDTEASLHALHNIIARQMDACCDMQHFTADAVGATHMNEIEQHEVARMFRHAVVDYTDYALDQLSRANLVREPAMAKLYIGLGALRDVCTDCELLRYAKDAAPALCQPAMFMTGKNQGKT